LFRRHANLHSSLSLARPSCVLRDAPFGRSSG
jgi:hypothetical protein